MDKPMNRKSLKWGVPGLIVWVLGFPVSGSPQYAGIGGLLVLVGTVLLGIGLYWYSKAKGWPGALGLLGLLGCIGWGILALLPDRIPEGGGAAPPGTSGTK